MNKQTKHMVIAGTDKITGLWYTPTLAINDASIIRDFKSILIDHIEKKSKIAVDFELFQIATYDTATQTYENCKKRLIFKTKNLLKEIKKEIKK